MRAGVLIAVSTFVRTSLQIAELIEHGDPAGWRDLEQAVARILREFGISAETHRSDAAGRRDDRTYVVTHHPGARLRQPVVDRRL